MWLPFCDFVLAQTTQVDGETYVSLCGQRFGLDLRLPDWQVQ